MHKALFLDRDGVINVEKDYLHKIEDFEFVDGIIKLCEYYQKLGFIIVVVTNQSGIARNYYTEDDFNILTTWMIQELLKSNIYIKKVYYCPHHPSINGECSCRKPKPGMLIQAAQEFDIDLSNSVLIGDKQRDIDAALNAGLKTAYLFDESKSIKKSTATKIVSRLEDIYNVNTK